MRMTQVSQVQARRRGCQEGSVAQREQSAPSPVALFRQRQSGVIVALRATTVSYECRAKVAELVDALDLGSSGVTRESSSLSFRTTMRPVKIHRGAA